MNAQEIVDNWFENYGENRETLWWVVSMDYDDNPLLWDCYAVIRHSMDITSDRSLIVKAVEILLDGRRT